MNWSSNQFILQSEDSDYYPAPQPITRNGSQQSHLSILYNEAQASSDDSVVQYDQAQPSLHSYNPIDEQDASNFDYSFLLQNNQQLRPSSSERALEEEPVIGDGARSFSSMGSNDSKQKMSKDDKRKRNTAASARFRIKKKIKEKELQSTTSEMTNKAKLMERRVQELEREVKWLKALVVEKDDKEVEKLVDEMPFVSFAFPRPSSSLEDL